MITRQQTITYLAAAGNIGLWVMAGILSEGGALPALVQMSIIGLSALALGLSMAFGLVEIAQKMATLPVEFERTRKDGTVKVTQNRRYQVARLVLFVIIGGESFLLMPVVVALAKDAALPAILPGAWLWFWAFGRVAASAALLAGLSAVLENGAHATHTAHDAKPALALPAHDAPDAKHDKKHATHVCALCGASLKTNGAYAAHMRWQHPKVG